MRAEDRQWYVRAEPSEESRQVLVEYQKQLQTLFNDLRLTPRLIKTNDLHWTALFIGSARRWSRALRALDVAGEVTADDLAQIAERVCEHLVLSTPRSSAESLVVGSPTGYDAFLAGGTNAVFVLRLEHLQNIVDTLVNRAREVFADWERAGRFPPPTTHQLFRRSNSPLARERNGGKPHVTLARGRVSRERQRDVLRTMRSALPVSRQPITFGHAEVRMVRESVPTR